jgi:hypothetical protein
MAIRSTSLDNIMGNTLQKIGPELLPRKDDFRSELDIGWRYPEYLPENSETIKEIKMGIEQFCKRFDTIEQIMKTTADYRLALSGQVKTTRKFLDILNSSVAVIGSAVACLPLLSSSSREDSQPAVKEAPQTSFAWWGIVCTGLTIATLAASNIKYLDLPPREETSKSLLTRLWIKLDGKAPSDLIEAGKNLNRQFRAHLLTYEYLCKRFDKEKPECLEKIQVYGNFFIRK